MKRILIILSCYTLTFNLFPQKRINVDVWSVISGYNYRQEVDLKGYEHEFPGRIHQFTIDEEGRLAAIDLRDYTKNGKNLKSSGTFLLYDLEEKRVLWSTSVNYNTSFILYDAGHILKQRYGGNISVLNRENGTENWSRQTLIFYADKKSQRALGYNFSKLTPTSNKLHGIDLTSGKTTWKREIDRTYGWNSIQPLNDSIILIASGGLHTVNLYNGKGWSYTTPTGGERVDKVAAAATAATVIAGLFAGFFVVPIGNDIMGGIESNALVDSTGIYHASAEKISRLNFDGEVAWSRRLDKDKCSESKIIRKNGYVYLYNKGSVYDRNKIKTYGKPFVAVFNENDGTTVYYNYFDEKDLILNDLYARGDTISLLFNNKLMKISMKNDSLLYEKQFDTNKNGQLQLFVNDRIRNLNNDVFELIVPDDSNYLVGTDSHKVFWLNKYFEIEQELKQEDYYILISTFPNYQLFYNNGYVHLGDKDKNLIAKVEAGNNIKYYEGKLYSRNGNTLKIVELNEWLEE